MDQKKIRLVIVVIAIIAIIAVIVKATSSNKQGDKKTNYSELQENGTLVNTSKKLAENKTYNGLEITDIKFSHSELVTRLNAKVKNITTSKIPEQSVDINVLDEEGNVITSFVGRIKELEPGETTAINSGIVANYANAYDIQFVSPTTK